jgi:heme-degrading monooxygenase HmoA
MSQRVAPPRVPVGEPVTLINAFTVPPEESERFLERWRDSARVMAGQPGFIRARLHRSLVDDAQLRFVNVADWGSGKALALAQADPEWLATVQRMLDDPDLHIIPRPAVYRVAIEVHPGDPL